MFGPRTTTPGIEPPQSAAPLPGMPGGPGAVESDVHVLDRLHVLYKYRKAMISVALLVLVAGVVQTYTTTPAYMGTTQVRAEPEQAQIAAVASEQAAMQGPDTDYFMTTELSVLKSRDLKRKVVRKLRLDRVQELETRPGPEGLEGALAAVKNRVMQPITKLLHGPAQTASATGPTADTGKPIQVPSAAAGQIETLAESTAIDVLGASLTIDPQPTSHLFLINFSSASPQLAAQIPNEMATEYAAQNLEAKRQSVQDRLTIVRDSLNALSQQVELDQKTLINTTAGANMLDPDAVQRNVEAAQTDLNGKTGVREMAEERAKDLKALDPDHDLAGAMTYPDIQTAIGTYVNLLSDAKTKKARDLASGLGPNHPTVAADQVQIDQFTNNIRDVIKAQMQTAQKAYQSALNAEANSQKVLDAQKAQQLENGRTGISFQSLKQNIETNKVMQIDMLKQEKQLEILAQGIANNVSIIEYAQPPARPYKPNTSRNILISLAVGIAMAIMLAFGLDYLDDTIKTPEDVTRKLHIPFLGLVPSVRGERQPVLSGPVPHDFGEAYRALRTSLVFTSGGESTRIITVTSAQPLEGKTTTACNLAMVLAFGGSRVLLIDADMRRPGIHKALKIANTVGLSHLLVGQARVRETIQRTSDPNFCVMTAGRTPPNPSELLASERMKQLVANLKQGPFDWVVIDTPPVLAVTDAVILTPLVDGVTFVLGAEMTRRRLAERAVQMLMTSRPRVVGAVLNRVNFDRNKYYYSRYYGYQYKSYYGTGGQATDASDTSDAKA